MNKRLLLLVAFLAAAAAAFTFRGKTERTFKPMTRDTFDRVQSRQGVICGVSLAVAGGFFV